MKETFIIKMIQAKRMELNACKELIPGSVRPHLHNIKKELYLLAKDCITSSLVQEDQPDKAKSVSRVHVE